MANQICRLCVDLLKSKKRCATAKSDAHRFKKFNQMTVLCMQSNDGKTVICHMHYLARNNSFAGANFSTRTALNACVGIDVVDIAFGDSFNGAYGNTCSASNAFVSDYVSHDFFVFGDKLYG